MVDGNCVIKKSRARKTKKQERCELGKFYTNKYSAKSGKKKYEICEKLDFKNPKCKKCVKITEEKCQEFGRKENYTCTPKLCNFIAKRRIEYINSRDIILKHKK